MKNDPTLSSALAGIYCAAVAVSALIISLPASVVYAADLPVPRSNVSVNVNPTTGYYSSTSSTVRLPNGVSVSPSASTPPVVSKYSGGLQQTIPTGITIDAIKKSAPLPAVVRSTTQTVKGAAGRCLKSGRCNVALLLAGEGLNRLFDGLDWVMGEGAQVQKINKELSGSDEASYSGDYLSTTATIAGSGRPDQWQCPTTRNGSPVGLASCEVGPTGTPYWRHCYFSRTIAAGTFNLVGMSKNTCFYGDGPLAESVESNFWSRSSVSDADIDRGVADNYNPEPSDWPALTPEMQPDDIEITSAPTLQGEPKTTTVYDADGNPHKVTETNIWYDFDIRDNPSPRPALDMKTREETKTYENGELTSTTTTTSGASAGSNDTPLPPPESPIDCDLFPTACAWFDWTQEEPIEPDTDLSGLLQEVPIVSETFTITGGIAACPAPMVLDLSVFGSREVSYQPLCDLASTMKFLYLALMSFAAAVLLNRSVNRV